MSVMGQPEPRWQHIVFDWRVDAGLKLSALTAGIFSAVYAPDPTARLMLAVATAIWGWVVWLSAMNEGRYQARQEQGRR